MSKMDNYLGGSWELFEQWIRNAIGSDFSWRVRPMDKRSNREMIAKLVQNDIKGAMAFSQRKMHSLNDNEGKRETYG